MENIKEITDSFGEVHVLIDRGNGEFTSMPKAVYDAQVEHLTEIPPQAALSTPIVSSNGE